MEPEADNIHVGDSDTPLTDMLREALDEAEENKIKVLERMARNGDSPLALKPEKFYEYFKSSIDARPNISIKFAKHVREGKNTVDIMVNVIGEQVGLLLSKLNKPYDDVTVTNISYKLLQDFSSLSDIHSGFVAYDKLSNIASTRGGWLVVEEKLKGFPKLESSIVIGLSEYGLNNSETNEAADAGDNARKTVYNKLNELVKVYGQDIPQELIEQIDEEAGLIGNVIEREGVLANTNIHYNKIIKGKNMLHKRHGFLPIGVQYARIDDIIYDEGNEYIDPAMYNGTLYKAYTNSGFATGFQFKEIFVGDMFSLSDDGSIPQHGILYLGNVRINDDPIMQIYYNRVRSFMDHVLREDKDIRIINMTLHFYAGIGDNDSIKVIQQITVPAYNYATFGTFATYLQRIIDTNNKLETGDYYSEANIPTEDLILDVFSIVTTRVSYVLGASHPTMIPILYNVDKTSLTDGLCAFRMLNDAFGMAIEEFNKSGLAVYESLFNYLQQYQSGFSIGGNSGNCFEDCSGDYFDEFGVCGECASKPAEWLKNRNKLAIISDAFYIDKTNLNIVVSENKHEIMEPTITKCEKCLTRACTCRGGTCIKCRKCKDCKMEKVAKVIVDKIEYSTVKEVRLNYLIGDCNSTNKYVMTIDDSNIFHVEKVNELKYPLEKLIVKGRDLCFENKVIADFAIIDKKAKAANIIESFAATEYKDYLLLLDFESTTTKDKHGCLRQVCYSYAATKISGFDLKKLSNADKNDDFATIEKYTKETEFVLEKDICPQGYEKEGVIVANIGEYLYNYLKAAALKNERFTIVTFNGCAYDHLILNELLTEIDVKSVDNVFFSGTKLNNMLIFNTHTLFDLRRHHATSLAKLCESFKVKSVAKTHFDHKAANIASSRGKLFEFLNKDMDGIVKYNKLDVLSMGVILSRFNDAIHEMNDSLPKILEPLSKIIEADPTAIIGGTGKEKLSFKKIPLRDVWHYQTAPSLVMKMLKTHWRDCGFVVNNYDAKTISKEAAAAYSSGKQNKTVKVIKKDARVKMQTEYRFYKFIMGDKVGGRVCMRYTITFKNGVMTRKCGAMFFKGRRYSIDACSLYPGSGLIAPEYLPYGNRIESKYIPGDTRIGFFNCKITQITEKNNNIYRPLRISKQNKELYPHLINPPLSNDWNNCAPIKRVMIDTVEIDYLRKNGCIVDVLDEEGFYFTGKIKNYYMFAVLLAIMKVKDGQDKFAKIIKDGKKLGDKLVGEQLTLFNDATANYNVAMRETAKLLMNSSLGKLIQRVFTSKTKHVTFLEYESLIEKGCEPTLLTSFGADGKALCNYTVSEIDNLSQSMPCHLGIMIYGISKRHMNDTILFNLPGGAQFDYSDTDSMHCSEEVFKSWVEMVNEKNILVPHWPELEQIFPEYATHKIYEPSSKVFLSFENELSSKINREIILGNKLYMCYNQEWYDEQIKTHGKVILNDDAKDFCKVSSAGINFGSYWVVNDLAGLIAFTGVNPKESIRMLSAGEISEEDVRPFCYRNDPRRAYQECFKYGYVALVREVFTRNIKEDAEKGIKSSTIAINVDLKLMKRIDYIDSEDDKLMMEEITKKGNDVYKYLLSPAAINKKPVTDIVLD